MELTPKQVVRELDRYIIGQDEAKRAVAVALRNRYRRAQLPEEIRDEIVPKNILMVGPTGVGKTEIARRLAKLVDAPFVKVEATKFTEVGYVGRDVESIIRDLVEASVRICKEKASQKVKARATVLAEERIIDLILHPNRKPVNPIDVLLGNKPKQPELPAEEKQRIAQKADELRAQLQRGELEDVEIEVEVEDAPKDVEINGASVNIGSMMGDMMPKKTKMRRMKVADARRLLVAEEEDKLIDMDAVTEEALRRAEQDGSDGQNAAAAAEIEHALAALNGPFQLAHTHLRGRVRAGAEDHAGVEQDLDAVFRVFRVQPLRNDQQPFADGQRLIVPLPVVFPVLVLDVCQLHVERAEVHRRVLRAQRGQLAFQTFDRFRHGSVLLQIQPDLRKSLHLLFQILVYIVPVLAVLLQKFMKLLLIVDDEAVKAQHGQPVADKVNGRRSRFDGQFDPLHDSPPDLQGGDLSNCNICSILHETGANDK